VRNLSPHEQAGKKQARLKPNEFSLESVHENQECAICEGEICSVGAGLAKERVSVFKEPD
jgi:hypothetical protein